MKNLSALRLWFILELLKKYRSPAAQSSTHHGLIKPATKLQAQPNLKL
jgi:hypothetical protein